MDYLVTKTTTPAVRPGIVPWKRHVLDLLKAGLDRKLTLVVAVAGSGKTTCLAEFTRTLVKSRTRTAWVSLEAGDNDPGRFWAYFFIAVSGVDPSLNLSVERGLRGSWSDYWTYLDGPLNEVAAAPFDIHLVLDDYHVIDSEAVHAGLAYWIDHMPANMHVAISTRTIPTLPLSPLRAQDQIVEIHSEDLFFDLGSTTDFLRRVKGLDVSVDDAQTLFELTCGWAAGLQLATMSMQKGGEAQGLVRDFSRANRFIGDFLIGEVLDQQDASTQDFLLKTSILKKLTAPLCEAVTGNPRSQEMLHALVQADLFLAPLDDFGTWFRYHALFSETLAQLLKEREPDGVSHLYQKASEWSEQAGMIDDAVEYAVLADDGKRVVHLLECYLSRVLPTHTGFRLLGWLRGLPEEMYRDSLYYNVLNAWGNFTSAHPVEARPWLERSRERLAEARGVDDAAQLEGVEDILATIEACITSMGGDHDRGAALSQKALEELGSKQFWLRATLLHNLGESLERIGDLEASMKAYLDARAACRTSGAEAMDSFSTYEIGWLYVIRGQLHLAADTLQQAINSSRNVATLFPPGLIQITLGRVNLIWNKREAAERDITLGLRLLSGSDHQPVDSIIESQVALAYLHEAKGDLAKASDIMAQAAQLVRSVAVARGFAWKALVCRAHIALAAGDLITAREAAEGLARGVPAHDTYYCLRRELIGASIARAQGQAGTVITVLDELLSRAEEAGYIGILIEAMVVRAACLQDIGETRQAIAQLSRAVDAAQPEGYVLPFLREGSAIGVLLHKLLYDPKTNLATAPSQREKAAFCRRLLEAQQARCPRREMVDGSQEARLSEREKQILELLRQGKSNKDIADSLFISLNTVKKHVQNIYEKTGAHDRAEASQVGVAVSRGSKDSAPRSTSEIL